MDQANLSSWIGRTETTTGSVDRQMAQMIHATLGAAGTPSPTDGEPLPHLWHWCAFPPTAPMADLGVDGHPRLGGFLPPVRLDRRMWAGGALEFVAPLHVGETLTRHSTITDLSEKTGAAGPMVFVTVAHEIGGAAGVAVRERQDIVYLAIPETFTPPRKVPAPDRPVLSEPVAISAALLFRYSAITFNAHRIHYDHAYATEVEKYPGLVVHGPLQASLLMIAATRHKGRAPDRFRFRGVHPMFADADLRVMAEAATDSELKLCTVAPEGHQGLQASAIWEEGTRHD
ncbi:MAG: MaoC family dehydratase N-terminal domain-containing protein [Rhodobacteraceae bacterium]|nr:MaoC family dehydratase N-terminal domain-containing protein [Paracoccaceae bacterium]